MSKLPYRADGPAGLLDSLKRSHTVLPCPEQDLLVPDLPVLPLSLRRRHALGLCSDLGSLAVELGLVPEDPKKEKKNEEKQKKCYHTIVLQASISIQA